MTPKRDLMFAVLLTFCVTATLFMIVPIRSQTSNPEYDPWVDLNDDGVINILDLVKVAIAFGASGEPINKTDLLLQLLADIEQLNATVPQLRNELTTLNNTVISMNSTLTLLNESSSPYPRFFYSNGGGAGLARGIEQGSTGWVTMKSATIPSNTLANRTVVVRWNVRSFSVYAVNQYRYTCFMRITLNGVEEQLWQFNPPMLDPNLLNQEFLLTSFLAISIPDIDNSVDLALNLDFRIDCASTGASGYAEIRNNEFEVLG